MKVFGQALGKVGRRVHQVRTNFYSSVENDVLKGQI